MVKLIPYNARFFDEAFHVNNLISAQLNGIDRNKSGARNLIRWE